MQESKALTDLRGALGDLSSSVYSDEDLKIAIGRALQEYSYYLPALRVMGQATLMRTAKAGSTTIEVVGGLPYDGLQYTIGYGSPANETITIAGIEPTPYNSTLLTLASPLVKSYYCGMLVSIPYTNGAAYPVIGLNLVAGQDTYQLPLDFIKIEAESFSLAIGDRLTYKANDAFYDETQAIFNQLNSTGYGRSAGWALQSGTGYPVVGNPFSNPFVQGVSGTQGVAFNFLRNEIPFMVMSVPSGTSKLLNFQYWGLHVLASVPNQDSEAIVVCAAANATHALASSLAQAGDSKIEDYEEANSKSSMALMKASAEFMERFRSLIVCRPYVISG